MPSLNKVFLMGNLTRDPELRYLTSGDPVGNFGIAINHRYTKDGEQKEDVCFVEITLWGKIAENCAEYLAKGRPVLVEGRLRYESWETQDGQKRNALKVVANNVQFLGGRKESDQKDNDTIPGPDDDIPFVRHESEDAVPF